MKLEAKIAVLSIAVILAIVAGIALNMGIQMEREDRDTLNEPQQITCRQLIAEGHGDNRHVVITDFQVVDRDPIPDPDSSALWIPLVPHREQGKPQRVVLLRSEHIKKPGDVPKLEQAGRVQGIVKGDHSSGVDADVRATLREELPGVTIQNCPVVEHRRMGSAPPTGGLGMICIWICVAMLLACGVTLLIVIRIPVREERIATDVVLYDDDDVAWWAGYVSGSVSGQKGVIVLRPDYVAFVPSEQSTNYIGLLAGGAASSVLPFQQLSLDAFRKQKGKNVGTIVTKLWLEAGESFDDCIRHVAERLNGQVWSREDTVVSRTGVRSGRPRYLSLVNGNKELAGRVDPRAAIDRMLSGWTVGAPLLRTRLVPVCVIAIIVTLFATVAVIGWLTDDLPTSAAVVWGVIAAAVWGCVGLVLWRHRSDARRAAAETADPAGQ